MQFRVQGLEEIMAWMLKALWEFPKIMGALVWGPYNKAPTI